MNFSMALVIVENLQIIPEYTFLWVLKDFSAD